MSNDTKERATLPDAAIEGGSEPGPAAWSGHTPLDRLLLAGLMQVLRRNLQDIVGSPGRLPDHELDRIAGNIERHIREFNRCEGWQSFGDSLDCGTFSEANRRRCAESFYPIESRSLLYWATAVSEEAGEICRGVKRFFDRRYAEHRHPEDNLSEDERAYLKKEIADVVMYLDLLAARAKIDLGEAVREKFNEVSDRVGSPIKL